MSSHNTSESFVETTDCYYCNGQIEVTLTRKEKEAYDCGKEVTIDCPYCNKKLCLINDEDEKSAEESVTRISGKPIIEFRGRNGEFQLYPKFLRINRGTAMGFLMQGLKGQKDIYFDKITSIQVKKPGFLIGYIQFSIGGGNESRQGVFDANKDENTVSFGSLELYEKALKAKEYIEKQMHAKSGNTPLSDAEEIEKLYNLMKKGVLTKEEFEHKKKELLGL
jgi:hypothetical protein